MQVAKKTQRHALIQWKTKTFCKSLKTNDLLQVNDNQRPAASHWQPTTCCKSLKTNDLLRIAEHFSYMNLYRVHLAIGEILIFSGSTAVAILVA